MAHVAEVTSGPKVVVLIPCYNEEGTVGGVVSAIPRRIAGVESVDVLVVDDGSTDHTGDRALRAGAEWVIRHRANKGLAAAFRTGVDAALRLGADIIVNLDGDGQYDPAEIPQLLAPILEGRADVVIGDRQATTLPHFSPSKRVLQYVGSWAVRRISGTAVPDAPSGFRAFSRDAALRLNVVSDFSYTLETLIQAGALRLALSYVPVTARAVPRQSRLFRSIRGYIQQSAATVLRVYTMYRPLRVFLTVGTLVGLVGAAGITRFLWFYVNGEGGGHIQSLVLSGALLILGFQIMLIGLVADLVAANRRLLEEALYRVRRLETGLPSPRPTKPTSATPLPTNGDGTRARTREPDGTRAGTSAPNLPPETRST